MNCPKCSSTISEEEHFCPECGAAIVAAPEPGTREAPQGAAAQIDVRQQVGTVEGGRVVGVDLGEVLGDVNIGNYTLRIGTVNGGVVNVAPPQQRWVPKPRPIPVMLLPRPFSGFLDRKDEVSAATAVLEGASPVEFYGPPGVGKTTLLHHLAHHKFAPVFPAGIVFFSEIRHRPVDDLLLDFFDAFYERDPTHIPTPVQVRHALREEHALVVLDDVDLEREQVEALMDAAPACVFLSASTERRLWSEGRTIALRGLPPEDAFALIERELERPLGEEDRTIVQQIYAALEGYPLRLLQLGALVRDDGISLADVAERLQQHAGSAVEAFTEQTLAQRSEPERRVLAALAVPMGASVGEDHLNALAEVADARPALESLQRRKLVQAHSPRYSLTGSLDEALREEWDLTPWNERALEYFAIWAEEQRHAPDRVLEEADAILGVLQRAGQEGRWEGALRLGRAAEGPLAVRGHWGAWAETLERELEAARQMGDRAAEAWSLHQLGTRALCLEDASTARADLTEALRLRVQLDDEEGAAVTRHNLNLLGGLGTDQGPEGDGGGGGSAWLSPGLWLGVIALVSALALLLAVLLRGGPGPTFSPGGPEPTPYSLTLDPRGVEAGETARGTVTLGSPAPPGGVAVSLSSSKPKVARVDPSVTIEEGNSSATFTISTSSAPFYALSNVAFQVVGGTDLYLHTPAQYEQYHEGTQYNAFPITLTTPAAGAKYVSGEQLFADYDCEDYLAGPQQAKLTSCEGDVSDGDRIDTGTVGRYYFTVTATYSGLEEETIEYSLSHEYEVIPKDGEGYKNPRIGDRNNDGVVDEDDFERADVNDDGVVNRADVSGQNLVKVTITASLKGVERSKTLIVRGVQ